MQVLQLHEARSIARRRRQHDAAAGGGGHRRRGGRVEVAQTGHQSAAQRMERGNGSLTPPFIETRKIE